MNEALIAEYPRIAGKIFGSPWMITPEAHASIVSVLESYVARPVEVRARRADLAAQTFDAALIPAASFTAGAGPAAVRQASWLVTDKNRKAQIPYNLDSATMLGQVCINGIIGKGLSALEMSCGGVCVDQLEAAVKHLGELGAQVIALHFSSPGGTVTGVPECAGFLSKFNHERVPLHAYTDTVCCSSAYYLAVSAESFTAAGSATIGSIGVLNYITDSSEEWAREGRKRHLLASGVFKGQGLPGVPVRTDFIAQLQAEVDSLAKGFFGHVIEHRRKAIVREAGDRRKTPEAWAAEIFEGQSWPANGAPRALFDAIIPDRTAHLREIYRWNHD